ncbi:MAG: alpha/beta fold hydrolase, partial [Acidobacteriia bacterium]|nr:alpha/beta fold hydrolase [Terriglobia bacterium]
SSPASGKACFFAERFAALGHHLAVPHLDGGDFENLTLSGQLAVIERTAAGHPVSLIGSSMGGYLAALYAARHRETQKVVLMAPAFDFVRRWGERTTPQEVDAWRQTGYLSVFHYGVNAEQRLSYRMMEDAPAHPDFPSVPQPCLIFHGLQDDVVPHTASVEFQRRNPHVELQLLDSGHELTDQVEHMWDQTRRFLGL